MDINYYMKLQNAYGTKSKREKDLVKVNYEMAKHFEDTFDTEDVLLNGNPFKLMIIKDTDGNTYKKKIKSRHDDKFNLGDYIEWNGQRWLITLLDTDEKTWNRGYMYQCTILLRWQNANGDIIERWGCSEDFTKYATGTYGNNNMTLGEYQYGITLPVDDDTKILKRDRRFAVDIDGIEPPDVYKLSNRKILLTDNRYFQRGGILTLTLSYSEFNADTDKKIVLDNGTEVWICDYHSPTPESTSDSSDNIRLKIECDTTLISASEGEKVLAAILCDSNDNVIMDDVSVTWDVESSIGDHLIYSINEGIITFSLSKKYSGKNDEIVVTCTSKYTGHSSTVTLTTGGV